MSAKSIAVKLLSRREHSVYELREKLIQREFSEDEVATAITELQQGGWLSDVRFAEAYIRMRQQKGFGPLRIVNELKERGVEESIVSQYLYPGDDAWQKNLRIQYQKKYKGKAIEDYNDKAKRIRFLQYRGFALDMIYQVVK